VAIKLHRFIAVEYADASSINKLCHSKIRIGMGKVNVKVKITPVTGHEGPEGDYS